MINVLFVCSRNRLRSPTAEQVFSQRDDIEVASAGTGNDADYPLSRDLIEWADLIVAMERRHGSAIRRRYRGVLQGKRIVCLDIADNYAFMEPTLVALLHRRMARHLPSSLPATLSSTGTAR